METSGEKEEDEKKRGAFRKVPKERAKVLRLAKKRKNADRRGRKVVGEKGSERRMDRRVELRFAGRGSPRKKGGVQRGRMVDP